KENPKLPSVGQMRVLKHYLRLSQENLGADFNIDIGQGTCTMKYNPKVNEKFVRSANCAHVHPLQDEETLQGSLQIMYELEEFLKQISGMDAFSLQPGSGSAAIFGMVSIINAYHQSRNDDQRNEIITTMFSHPSDAAAGVIKGYKIINIREDENGYPNLEELKKNVSERTAGLLITNPEDIGIFNKKIKEFTRIVHEAGGICGYDQANANGILGITRAKEADFDMCFFNLHKTFASPHGCGGPASGSLGVVEKLKPFLPIPCVKRDNDRYKLVYDKPLSIGKIRGFMGVFPAILRAYAWIRSLGEEGLKTVAKIAVLNNNYILEEVKKIKGASAPFAKDKHRIEQVRYSWEKLFKDTSVTTEDIALKMADYGFHLWSSHHPYIVPQPFTIEPTESYSKEELDEYLEALREISKISYNTPEILKSAPQKSVVHRIIEETFDDPEKWAITWRLYNKKK
ncbi:MAG: aminomethyl-transferring glycine dehydrogenase subunit GcvPB, partial [Thermotogota bacterium]|nr:aminomethyl-transferring glycine dehydrogenase subunit GcvPB [Thermotogota bacterium]